MTRCLYLYRPSTLRSLQMLVNRELLQGARLNYIADMLWLLAGGKQYKDGSIEAFSSIMRKSQMPADTRTGEEIMEEFIESLR